MNINKKGIVLLLLILFTIGSFAQNKIKHPQIFLPVSIYSVDSHKSFLDTVSNINSKLGLKKYKFPILDIQDIEDGFFSISIENLNRKPTKYIYDDYQEIYRNINLNKYISVYP